MEQSIKSVAVVALLVFLSSCGVGGAFIYNHNQNATQVHLASNNFKVLDKVSGTSEVTYILGIGGLKKKQLYKNAYANMLNEAELANSSRAIANVLTEEHVGGVPPFYFKRTITVSAHVIEFVNE